MFLNSYTLIIKLTRYIQIEDNKGPISRCFESLVVLCRFYFNLNLLMFSIKNFFWKIECVMVSLTVSKKLIKTR
jgi:hypothetical protein